MPSSDVDNEAVRKRFVFGWLLLLLKLYGADFALILLMDEDECGELFIASAKRRWWWFCNEVATPSSLNSSLHDVHEPLLLLAGLEPRIHGRGECGDPDRLISTNAALHSSICSSSRNPPIYISPSCVYDGRRLRELRLYTREEEKTKKKSIH